MAAAPPSSTPSLPPRVVRGARRIEQDAALTWQLLSTRLPCWVVPPREAAEAGHMPVLPTGVFLIRSSGDAPVSLAKTAELSGPAAANEVLSTIVAAITSPPEHARPAARPARINFSDALLGAACAAGLAALGVAVGTAPPPPALRSQAVVFANELVSRGLAMTTNSALIPSLSSSPAIRDDHLRAFYSLAAEFAAIRPWEFMGERQALRMRFPGGAAPAAGYTLPSSSVVWASVGGQDSLIQRQEALKAGIEPSRLPPMRLGLHLFFKRFDAEARLMHPPWVKKAAMLRQTQGPEAPLPPPLVAVSNALDLVCASCSHVASSSADKASSMSRCMSCKEVYYCDSKCQAADWPSHKAMCKENGVLPLPTPSPSWQGGPPVPQPPPPARGFVSVLFVPPMDLPCGDHDDLERLGITPAAAFEYPFALFNYRGSHARPNIPELSWLIRALAVAVAFLREHAEECRVPTPMTEEVAVQLVRAKSARLMRQGGGAEGAATPASAYTPSHWYDATGEAAPTGSGPLTAFVRTDPLLTLEERDAFINKLRAHEAELESHRSGMRALLGKANSAESREMLARAVNGPAATQVAAGSTCAIA